MVNPFEIEVGDVLRENGKRYLVTKVVDCTPDTPAIFCGAGVIFTDERLAGMEKE